MGEICGGTTTHDASIADGSLYTYSLWLCTRILDHHPDTQVHAIHDAFHHPVSGVNRVATTRAFDIFLSLWYWGTSQPDEQYSPNPRF
jgi:hypothetical protein